MTSDLWTAATEHRFLTSVREGSVTAAEFDRWLTQDALFVADLLVFQARLLARAPRPDQGVIAGGCVALVSELDWFDGQAARRGIDLAARPLETTLRYRDLLRRLDSAPYRAAVTALWALERVYLMAWTTASPAGAALHEFVDHWTDPAFADYVDGLAALAAPDEHADLIDEVLTLEVAFWDMAFDSP